MAAAAEEVAHDIQSLLSSPERDFLVRNNGDQVKIDSLKGKKVGLYFSASWCGPCQQFTPILIEVYKEVSTKGEFEIIFVTADRDEEAFNAYFSKMPWLAVPFADSDTCNRLDELFKVMGIPYLVILDENGKVVTEDGTEVIREYGVEAYPFTSEKIKELKDQEEEARRNQSLRSILISGDRDFVISSDGNKVPIPELEGKTVGLYFSVFEYKKCSDFTPKLVEVYEKLKAKGESLEVVLLPLDNDEESFNEKFKSLPWLSLPFKDKSCAKLARYFELETLPTLVIIGPDGKTLHSNVTEAIEDHGVIAYPFTPEKFAELAEIEKAREEAQTLESILVSEDLDYVIGKDGAKIPVSDLVGKTILVYFSAHWCPPCRAFTPKLIEVYHKIKEKDSAFEVVFISSDRDRASFEEYFAGMPWLALPYGDSRKAFLSRRFKVLGIPMLVAIGPSGRTVTKEARDLIMAHGADAYPFTEERMKQIEKEQERMKQIEKEQEERMKQIEKEQEEIAKGWPEKKKHKSHEHELVLTERQSYVCDGCDEMGSRWSYYCGECDFDLHPNCALKKTDEDNEEDEGNEEGGKDGGNEGKGKSKDGWVCDGEVCTKA